MKLVKTRFRNRFCDEILNEAMRDNIIHFWKQQKPMSNFLTLNRIVQCFGVFFFFFFFFEGGGWMEEGS